jgi:hypothetical protein
MHCIFVFNVYNKMAIDMGLGSCSGVLYDDLNLISLFNCGDCFKSLLCILELQNCVVNELKIFCVFSFNVTHLHEDIVCNASHSDIVQCELNLQEDIVDGNHYDQGIDVKCQSGTSVVASPPGDHVVLPDAIVNKYGCGGWYLDNIKVNEVNKLYFNQFSGSESITLPCSSDSHFVHFNFQGQDSNLPFSNCASLVTCKDFDDESTTSSSCLNFQGQSGALFKNSSCTLDTCANFGDESTTSSSRSNFQGQSNVLVKDSKCTVDTLTNFDDESTTSSSCFRFQGQRDALFKNSSCTLESCTNFGDESTTSPICFYTSTLPKTGYSSSQGKAVLYL